MDSGTETALRKPKKKYVKNLQANECVRPFKLRRHFPSTVTELKKNGIDKSSYAMQSKAVKNIISALPLSDNMKFIPNKDVQPSEVQNVQKLKLKSINGKDLGVVNVTMHNNIQTKIMTIPKIIQKSNRFKKWAEPVDEAQGQNPKIKNITQILNSSPFEEQCEKSEEASFSKPAVQIINDEKNLTLNSIQSCSKPILVQSIGSDVLQKIVAPNVMFNSQPKQPQLVTMKQISGFPKVLMLQNADSQLLTPTSENCRQFSLVRKRLVNNTATKKDYEKVIIQTELSNTLSAEKRDGSSLDQPESIESKRLCLDMGPEEFEKSHDSNKESFNKKLGESSEIKSVSNLTASAATTKNIMVIVPNEAAKEAAMASNSLDMNSEDYVLDDNCQITFLNDKDIIESTNFNQDDELSSKKTITSSPNQEETESSINQNNYDSKSESLLDRFSILEKAVLSVKDDNLRAKALKALQDCGIKSKKKCLIKRPLPTKIISESAVQTNVFSLLKEGEFLEADEAHENLMKIKLTRKSTKPSITFLGNKSKNEICEDQTEYKKNLDIMINKIFRRNKNVNDIKNAFVKNKKLQAEYMLKKLLKDFEVAKNYDSNGYLGIHKAVINNDLQDVQKHMIILKATKQNIDICTEDGQTSLELAVELEVDPQITKILLENGAQPVSERAVHNSALTLAAKKSSKLLPLLLKHISRNQKKLVNATDLDGLAAIHYCAQNGNLEGITELIRHGADVNIQDERSGRTALFYAVDTKSSDVPQEVYNEIAQKLVDNGAFSNIPTFSKHSVLSLIDEVKSHTLKIALNRAVR